MAKNFVLNKNLINNNNTKVRNQSASLPEVGISSKRGLNFEETGHGGPQRRVLKTLRVTVYQSLGKNN